MSKGGTMQVQVKLFATLGRYCEGIAPGSPFKVELPEGASLQVLVDRLRIPPEETKVTFVNGVVQPLEWILQEGDEVGIFPPIGGGSMPGIVLDVWLYGALARYGGQADQGSFANLKINLPEYSTMSDLLTCIGMPTEARGITFINGQLSAMPGVQPDLDHRLHDGDRIAFFHLQSMWPFQYRFGVPVTQEMSQAMQTSQDQGIRHSYETE